MPATLPAGPFQVVTSCLLILNRRKLDTIFGIRLGSQAISVERRLFCFFVLPSHFLHFILFHRKISHLGQGCFLLRFDVNRRIQAGSWSVSCAESETRLVSTIVSHQWLGFERAWCTNNVLVGKVHSGTEGCWIPWLVCILLFGGKSATFQLG